MQFTNNEIATYLFCAQLSQTKTTPLTILEWNSVVKSLSEQKQQPEALLSMTSSELLNALTQATDAQKSKILKKVAARQKLGISMLELEDIVQQGYNIMFRQHMPPRLKKLTQKFLPAFFYYAGDPLILSHRTLGVVGARNANDEELLETTKIAREAVTHGVVINSGGARGVDMTAVEAALQNGGKAVLFPVEGLAKWVKKREIRQYIMNGQLLLMSTQRLDAPFSPSFAMQRNKFIHASSDAVLVASSKISGAKSSGTWEGVLENIKMQWSPIYVIGESEGVQRLTAEGHAKYFQSFEDIYKLSAPSKQLEEDKNNINFKIKELIQLAAGEGMEKETIEKIFIELLEQYYTEESGPIKEKLVQSEKAEELEQLSIIDILNEKVNS
jgi:DNA processing protein